MHTSSAVHVRTILTAGSTTAIYELAPLSGHCTARHGFLRTEWEDHQKMKREGEREHGEDSSAFLGMIDDDGYPIPPSHSRSRFWSPPGDCVTAKKRNLNDEKLSVWKIVQISSRSFVASTMNPDSQRCVLLGRLRRRTDSGEFQQKQKGRRVGEGGESPVYSLDIHCPIGSLLLTGPCLGLSYSMSSSLLSVANSRTSSFSAGEIHLFRLRVEEERTDSGEDSDGEEIPAESLQCENAGVLGNLFGAQHHSGDIFDLFRFGSGFLPNALFSASADGSVGIWDVAKQKGTGIIPLGSRVVGLAGGSEESGLCKLVFAGYDGCESGGRVHAFVGDSRVQAFEIGTRDDRVQSIGYRCMKDQLVVGHTNGMVSLYDLRITRKRLLRMEADHRRGLISSVIDVFGTEDRFCCSCWGDGSVKAFDSTGTEKWRFRTFREMTALCNFLDDPTSRSTWLRDGGLDRFEQDRLQFALDRATYVVEVELFDQITLRVCWWAILSEGENQSFLQ